MSCHNLFIKISLNTSIVSEKLIDLFFYLLNNTVFAFQLVKLDGLTIERIGITSIKNGQRGENARVGNVLLLINLPINLRCIIVVA